MLVIFHESCHRLVQNL